MSNPNGVDERRDVITNVAIIVEDIRRRGVRGTTTEEASYRLNVAVNSYTGRRSELLKRGVIERLAEKRGGQHVYVMPDHVEGRETAPYVPHHRPAGPVIEAALDEVEHWHQIGDSDMPDTVANALQIIIEYVRADT